MKLTTLAALSLCSALTAQTFVTSPPGFLSLEGYGRCAHFGDAPDFRSMIVDGTHLGGARNLRSVSLRRKPFVGTLVRGVIWGSVTLDVSLGVSKMTRTFSSNSTSPPTRVFNTAVVWPSWRSWTEPSPSPWGGANGELSFPFGNPWPYSGSAELCLDFSFRGGRLLNGASFATTSYPLDSWGGVQLGSDGHAGQLGLGGDAGGCVDTAWAATSQGGFASLNAYSMNWSMALESTTYMTAAGRPVVHAIATNGSAPGSPFPGVSCNRLHLVPANLVSLLFTTAGPTESRAFSQIYGTLPFTQSFVGLRFWSQAAWDDSTTRRTMLTSAGWVVVPPAPITQPRLGVLLHRSVSPTVGSLSQYPLSIPMIRYGF